MKTAVHLTDARVPGGMNAVHATHFPAKPPASTTLKARQRVDIRGKVIADAPVPRG